MLSQQLQAWLQVANAARLFMGESEVVFPETMRLKSAHYITLAAHENEPRLAVPSCQVYYHNTHLN